MNLFRSKEHAKKGPHFKPGTEAGILSVEDAMRIMSTPRHRNRLSPNYVSEAPAGMPAWVQGLLEVSNNAPFWDLRP